MDGILGRPRSGKSMGLADAMLGRVLAALPGAAAAVRASGETPLARYAAGLLAPARPGLQSRDDFLDAAGAEAGRLLGPDAAAALVRGLDARPAALTANHHGADFQAQSVQGTLLVALPALLGASPDPVVPVLACGVVPLASFAFARGIVLSRRAPREEDADPRAAPPGLRVPVFPWKFRSALACAAPPFTRDMVARALAAARGLEHSGAVTRAEARALEQILAEDFGDPAVLALPGYADQAVVLNARLWGRLFADPEARANTQLAYLELERIAAALLARDVADPGSLLAGVFFDPGLRGAVLAALDRGAGCWDLGLLSGLAAGGRAPEGNDSLRGCGTVFFWGLDPKARRVPLGLAAEGGRAWLRGRGLSGDAVEVELAPRPIVAALAARRIAPGLFASYACLALARGVRCLGGVYQADYLPAMRAGLAAGLAACGDRERAAAVAAAPAGDLAAGPEFVFARYPGGELAPAGPVELAAAGGLTRADLARAGALTLAGALRAGLGELYAEFTPLAEREPGWRQAAAPVPGPGGPAMVSIPD